MHHDARLEFFDHPGVEVALPLGGSAREQHHVREFQRPRERLTQRHLVVSEGTQEVGITAQLPHRVGQDAPVAVVDETGPNRFAGLHDLVAGGEDRHARPAQYAQLRLADGSQHAGVPRAEPGAGKEHGLAGAHVRARKGDRGARHALLADDQLPARFVPIRELHGQHRVGTARQHAPGGDGGSGAREHLLPGKHAGGNRLVVQAQAQRRVLGGAIGVLGAQRETVHVGAVEARHVHLGGDILGEHAAQRLFEGNGLRGERGDVEDRTPATLGLIAIQHLEELLLLHASSSGNSSS